MIFFCLLFSLLPILIEYWFIRLAPHTFWFDYKSVEPEKAIAAPGEVIKFISTSQINRPVDFDWVDVLRCENPAGIPYFAGSDILSDDEKKEINNPFATATSSAREVQPRELGVKFWEYPAKLPFDEGTCCYLESTIEAHLEFGIDKKEQIRSVNNVCIE